MSGDSPITEPSETEDPPIPERPEAKPSDREPRRFPRALWHISGHALPFVALGISAVALVQSWDARHLQQQQARVAAAALEPNFVTGPNPPNLPYNYSTDEVVAIYNEGAPVSNVTVNGTATIDFSKIVNDKPVSTVVFSAPNYFNGGAGVSPPAGSVYGTGLVTVVSRQDATALTTRLQNESTAFNRFGCDMSYKATLNRYIEISYQNQLGTTEEEYFQLTPTTNELSRVSNKIGTQAFTLPSGKNQTVLWVFLTNITFPGLFSRWKYLTNNASAATPSQSCRRPIASPQASSIVVAHAGPTFEPRNREIFSDAESANSVTFDSVVNDPWYGDQRAFTTVGQPGTKANWSHRMAVHPGEELEVHVYYQNDATTNKPLIARGTRVRFALPVGSHATQVLTGYISADNARPRTISDRVTLTAQVPFSISYLPGTAKIWTAVRSPGSLGNDVVTSGALVGFTELDGLVPGGLSEGTGWVTIQIKIVGSS